MPINTRSQGNNSEQLKRDFILNMNKLIDDNNLAKDHDNKMKVALDFYKLINKDLNKLIQSFSIDIWINFIRTVYYKILEFESDYHLGKWNEFDKNILHNFIIEFTKTKKYLIHLIKSYHGDNWQVKAATENADFHREKAFKAAEAELLRAKQEKMCTLQQINAKSHVSPPVATLSERPRRNIKRVNYRI